MTNAPHPVQWNDWMGEALDQARRCQESGDVPVGAIVVDSAGTVIGRGHNVREASNDPAGHAEIVAMRQAALHLGTPRLAGCTLVSTLEPCVMCAGAIGQAGITRLIYGALDLKAGAAGGGPLDLVRERSLPYRVDEVVGGVRAGESSALLTAFFESLRAN